MLQEATESVLKGHQEQFTRRLEGWLFECAYGRRRVW